MIKYWAQQDTHKDFLSGISNLDLLLIGKEIMADPAVIPMEEPVFHQPFPEMDRVVHFRPGFAFGLSLLSSRINGYEFNAKTPGSTSGVNKRAWYTGYGMTYLYNRDLEQFEDSFWATINPYRLPGTTVDTRPLANAAGANIPAANEWAGSAEISDLYGVAGLDLKSQFGSLTAKKSWFMFDDEIVALGAGITSTDAYSVETIVENRRLNSAGSNALVVNGTAKSSALGWTETLALPAKSWLHLAGNAATGGSLPSVGYFFPDATSLKGLREQRVRYWTDINTDGSSGTRTRNYLTLWTDHGVNPSAPANTYAYALLPNKTTTQLVNYAASPDFTVVANTPSVQAVREKNLNIVAANFWTDTSVTAAHITSDRQASVLTREFADEIEIAVSDPTQLGTITQLDIGRTALAFISGDARITVTRLSPTIQLSVDVSSGTPHTDDGNGIRGKTWKARFRLPDGVKADNADLTGITTNGTWTPVATALDSWNGTHLRGASGSGAGTVTFAPKLTAGLYQVYVWWSAENAAANASNVPMTITHAGGSTALQVNQRQTGGQWVSLGAYTFNTGTSGKVVISSSGANGHVLADAVRFVPRTRVVRFDCGDPLLKTNTGNWNNVARATTALITTNALDSTGLGTGMGFNITTAFLGITSTGTTATTAGFPATATQDALYVQGAQEAKIKLQGLDPATLYTVNFYASGALAGDGSTAYSVGTRSVTLDAAANIGNAVSLADIVPDPDGSFRVGIKSATGSGHGYLGVVEVVW
jgi:hyaluronate lyase